MPSDPFSATGWQSQTEIFERLEYEIQNLGEREPSKPCGNGMDFC
jgi:hypothetical protein